MGVTAEGIPLEGDVHLRIWLSNVVFDYTATAAAAHNLIHDWRRGHWYTIELIHETTDHRRLLPRLPYERLFLGPFRATPRCQQARPISELPSCSDNDTVNFESVDHHAGR
ncbi:hypothetical protein ACW2Q0_04275 [Nocardia sp. R16R-3T]